MHRFRRKSDARSPLPEAARTHAERELLPTLPPVDDFRTSLILPDLTRRFTLLQKQTGDPLSVTDLHTQFAEQRARGAAYQVTEDEEALILQTLGQMRSRYTGGDARSDEEDEGDDGLGSMYHPGGGGEGDSGYAPSFTQRRSVRSTSTVSSGPRSPTRPSKRYSNNLFASGGHSYSRLASQYRTGSNRSLASVTSSESLERTHGNGSVYSNNLRPVTPDQASMTVSIQSSPGLPDTEDEERKPIPRSAPLAGAYSYAHSPSTAAAFRLSKTFTPSALTRVSLSLDEVLSRLEEAGEDEIVMPRTTPLSPVVDVERDHSSEELSSSSVEPSSPASGPIAVSSDKRESADGSAESRIASPSPIPRPGTTSPTPRLPGYIPGMPRPMTPRNVDLHDDLRSHSTTPRAAGPYVPSPINTNVMPPSLTAILQRRGSNASNTRGQGQGRAESPATATKTTTTPFFARSTNGRFTPEPDSSFVDFANGNGHTSPEGRSRPVSPLTRPSFQSMAAPTSPSASGSRPGTPSNVTWNTQPRTHSRSGSGSAGLSIGAHSRNGSWASFTGGGSSSVSIGGGAGVNGGGAARASSDIHGNASALERNKSLTRSLRSPALPDSPFIDAADASMNGSATSIGQGIARPPSAMSGVDLGSPIALTPRTFRSETPTQRGAPALGADRDSVAVTNGHGHSPSQGSSSHGHGHGRGGHKHSPSASSSAPFSLALGSPHAGMFSPLLASSSRSSLESDGSSYHSWDGDAKRDRGLDLLFDLDPDTPVWHDVHASHSTTSVHSSDGDEEIIRQYAALTKADFGAIQTKLVGAATAKQTMPESTNRAPSLRRRRPSTSRSTHSFTDLHASLSSPSDRERHAASPPPPTVEPIIPPQPPAPDPEKIMKANALLETVIDHIQSPKPKVASPPSPEVSVVVQAPTEADISTLSETQSTPHHAQPEPLAIPTSKPIPSSPGRRNRDLARALFGFQEDELATPSDSTTPTVTNNQDLPTPIQTSVDTSTPPSLTPASAADQSSPVSPSHSSPISPNGSASVAHNTRSTSASPGPLLDSSELAKDVQRRAEAATAALRKTPSIPKLHDLGSAQRKRINTQQIGSPTLNFASTSVDMIPLASPTIVSPSPSAKEKEKDGATKLGSRFKKFRGTLRGKSTPNGEEVEPFPLDASTSTKASPPANPRVSHEQHSYAAAAPSIKSVSAEQPGRAKSVASNSPGSAGPSLKGFMARFRKQKPVETVVESGRERRDMPPPPLPASTVSSATSRSLHAESQQSQHTRSIPTANGTFSSGTAPSLPSSSSGFATDRPLPAAPEQAQERTAPTPPPSGDSDEEATRRQLFEAAARLGLNADKLNDLVAQSTVTSPRSTGGWTMLTRNNSAFSAKSRDRAMSPTTTAGRPSIDDPTVRLPVVTETRPSTDTYAQGGFNARPSMDTIASFSGGPSEGRPSVDAPVFRRGQGTDANAQGEASQGRGNVFRKLSVRKNAEQIRKPRDGGADAARPSPSPAPGPGPAAAVVRRTIIFSSDPRMSSADLNALVQKAPKQRRRASATPSTHSGRSVHERAPTPPPPRGGSRRFSTDNSPPVPRLPSSFSSRPGTANSAVPGQMEHSDTYDSLYEMYAGDIRLSSGALSQPPQTPEPLPESESRPAIEVIEMANGETIWSIVNGLREDEGDDSYIDNRTSFASEFSMAHESNSDGVQLFFKDHGRNQSKGSNISFLSRTKGKKAQPSGPRPETKVFYSSSTQMARLIENLSRGVDAGSFNIMPGMPGAGNGGGSGPGTRGHSLTASSVQSGESGPWSVEERLDRMIGAMGP